MATYVAGNQKMGDLGKSAPIFNPQLLADMVAGLNAFQQNPTINPMQRAALDEQIGFRDTINQSFNQIGSGARQALNQQFGTQMKNLGANFQRRGLAGSSLAAVGQVGLEGERQSAVGDLENTLINAQSDAIRSLSEDFSGTLGGIGDQNASVFASLLRLLQPQVGADDYVRASSQQASMPGGGGGGGGSSGSTWNEDYDKGHNSFMERFGNLNDPGGRAGIGGSGSSSNVQWVKDASGKMVQAPWTKSPTGEWTQKTPKKAEAASFSGGTSGGGGSGGSGSAGGGGGAAPSAGGFKGAGGGFSGFGGGLLPVAPPPPPPPAAPGGDDEGDGEGEGDGEDEGPKYIFGWQKSGKSKFNPMNPVIKAGS